MEKVNIVDLYEGANESKKEEFKSNINSKLNVKTDYQNVKKDIKWIEMLESTIPYLDNILRNPNRFIINEEEIVKIELARKITVDSIKHLSKNTNLIQDINKKTGDVRPSKILNINKEESYDTYENRLIYTLIQNMRFFINNKKKTLEQFANIDNKNDKEINYEADSTISNEKVNISLSLKSKSNTESNKEEVSGDDLLERIAKLEVKISDLTSSEVYKMIDKKHITLVRSPLKKTNVVLKNVNFQYAVKLWDYLQSNPEDRTESIEENKEYADNGNLKELADESFFLQYLILNTLDKDKENVQNVEKEKEIVNIITDKIISRMININQNLTEEEFQKILGDKFAVIKYKSTVTMQEIQKIFRKNIDKYLEKVE